MDRYGSRSVNYDLYTILYTIIEYGGGQVRTHPKSVLHARRQRRNYNTHLARVVLGWRTTSRRDHALVSSLSVNRSQTTRPPITMYTKTYTTIREENGRNNRRSPVRTRVDTDDLPSRSDAVNRRNVTVGPSGGTSVYGFVYTQSAGRDRVGRRRRFLGPSARRKSDETATRRQRNDGEAATIRGVPCDGSCRSRSGAAPTRTRPHAGTCTVRACSSRGSGSPPRARRRRSRRRR